jgi:hypothetical protein
LSRTGVSFASSLIIYFSYTWQIIEEMDSRFEMPIIEELVELVEEVLPPPPGQPKAEGGTDENEEETGEGEEDTDENEAADEEEPETS